MIIPPIRSLADEALARCDALAAFTDEPGRITRTYLSPQMHHVHRVVGDWMRDAGMSVRIDAVGNIIGRYPGATADAPVLLVGSHLDTVPNAGRYDGILGVVLGIATVRALGGERLPYAIDVIGFSEEEGVRFRASYLGSKAVCGTFAPALLDRLDAAGTTMRQAIRDFGLDPDRIPDAAYRESVLGYHEIHIEQGPVLESLGVPLGVVRAIVGQSRLWLTFEGRAGHAGTQPMELRRDALVGASEFAVEVERVAVQTDGMRATVGVLSVAPGAVNVVPGSARLSLDVRHADDAVRQRSIEILLESALAIGARRGLGVLVERAEDHAAVPMALKRMQLLSAAARDLGYECPILDSGAGHDAAVMAGLGPATMLFVRSPGGISHHPDEAVFADDVAAALDVTIAYLHRLAREQS